MSFRAFLEQAFARNEYDIARRPYDGQYNVWRKHLEINEEDNSFSVWWEVVAVTPTMHAAREVIERAVENA